jgi:hypothetical protein
MAKAFGLALFQILGLTGCAAPSPTRADSQPVSQPTSRPYDTTIARPMVPRDVFERMALERGVDFRLIDRLTDEQTRPPPFTRQPLPPMRPDAGITDKIGLIDERDPFPQTEIPPAKQPGIQVGLGRSTFRTHDPEEVLAALEPFKDLEQREVNVRPEISLFETADQAYYALLDGKQQLIICHVFDYLLMRSWMAGETNNGTILLGVARPAHPRVTPLDRDAPGVAGGAVEIVVRNDAAIRTPRELKGARLALAARYAHAPGAFLTRVMLDAGQPLDQPFFSGVTLRRYPKDAVLDVLYGKADAACVPLGTMGALTRLYGLEQRIRTLVVSPRYNIDVLLTSLNNVSTHRTEIELTQRQLATLRKNPEGQEVLFFFDEEGWQYPQGGEIAPAEAAFEDFLTFYEKTPADLKALLDPAAPVDRRTYDRAGDE